MKNSPVFQTQHRSPPPPFSQVNPLLSPAARSEDTPLPFCPSGVGALFFFSFLFCAARVTSPPPLIKSQSLRKLEHLFFFLCSLLFSGSTCGGRTPSFLSKRVVHPPPSFPSPRGRPSPPFSFSLARYQTETGPSLGFREGAPPFPSFPLYDSKSFFPHSPPGRVFLLFFCTRFLPPPSPPSFLEKAKKGLLPFSPGARPLAAAGSFRNSLFSFLFSPTSSRSRTLLFSTAAQFSPPACCQD